AHPPLHLFHRQKPEPAGRALLDRVVGDVPGDRAIVGDVQHETFFAVEQAGHGELLEFVTARSLVGDWCADKQAKHDERPRPLRSATSNQAVSPCPPPARSAGPIIARSAAISFVVTGPGLSLPIALRSMRHTGITCMMLLVRNTSSASRS